MTILTFKTTTTPGGEEWDTPIVSDLDIQDSYTIDTQLKQIRDSMPRTTPENCDWAFWNESVSQSFVYMVAAILAGDKFVVKCSKKSIAEKMEKLIAKFNKKVNVSGDTIYDYLRDDWVDNCVHGRSVWRILRTKEQETKVDISRVDPITLEMVTEPIHGYKMYIQSIGTQIYSYSTAESFYKNYDPLNPPTSQTGWVKIPIDPDIIVGTSYFHQAPVKSALKYMNYKLWILRFMFKYSEKHWAPLLIASIGLPGKYIPRKKEMDTVSAKLKEVMKNIHNFSALTLPGYIDVKSFEPSGGGRASEMYVSYIDMLDKQIMFSFFGSMSARDASGKEKSTQQGVREEQHMFLASIRNQRNEILCNFYANVLAPENGIENCEPEDLYVEQPPLFFMPLDVVSQGVMNLGQTGFIDKKEGREMIRTSFPNLSKDNDEGKVITQIEIAKARPQGTLAKMASKKPGTTKSAAGTNVKASNPRASGSRNSSQPRR